MRWSENGRSLDPSRPVEPASLRYQQVLAVARLGRRLGNRAALGNALAGRQRCLGLDVIDEQVERLLRVRLDHHQLRERKHEALDVVPVLHFV